MTGNLQAIGFLLTWVLGWAIGGSLLEAGFTSVGAPSLVDSSFATPALSLLWSLLWGAGGFWLYRQWTRSTFLDQ